MNSIQRPNIAALTTILTLASVAVIVRVPPDADEIWWLKPAMVLAGAYSLHRIRSALAVPIFVVGMILMVNAYRRMKVREAVHDLTNKL